MKHIYTKHQHLKQMTIDDLLVRHGITHAEYRRWLVANSLPLYAITRGLYDEAILSDDPQHEFNLTRSETHKILYSKGWTEPRKSKTDDIIKMLSKEPQLPQDYIAHILGVTQARVSQVARQNDLRPERKRRTEVDSSQVLKLKNEGVPAPVIARKLNISLSTVYKKCKNT